MESTPSPSRARQYLISLAVSKKTLTFSSGVPTRTPWPRLSTCPVGPALAHLAHRVFHSLRRREEHGGIDVPLNRLIAHSAAAVLHVDGPVEADAVHAGGGHALEQTARAVGVEGQGHARVGGAHLVHHLLNVGLAPLLPHVRGQLTPQESKIWTHCAPASIWYPT